MCCGGGIEVKFRYENLFSGIHSEISYVIIRYEDIFLGVRSGI